ncbi:MAG: ABC transporter ATP-binding protein, partial [Planctomycetota bacterium]
MSNKNTLIKINDLKKDFVDGSSTLSVLKGISFTLAEADSLAVTGTSGCGKSTLLHITGLLDMPTSGEYFFKGKNTAELSDKEKNKLRNNEIGFVFQHFHLIRELTVLENILLPSLLNTDGKSENRSHAEYLLERVGLKDRMTHKPDKLSGGEKQRSA